MLLTLTTTREPATDLGFLLHKHPDRAQAFEVASGVARVFFPEASAGRCTAALLLEVDPVALVRGRRDGGEGFALGQYVNDRPYAASSLLAVALSRVFKTAMAGRCDARPELAAASLPLEIRIPALPCRGGGPLAERLFGPLGWTVQADTLPLDPEFPEWGESPYVNLRLTGETRLAEALNHVYVLLPVLDDAKHYWVTTDEVDKLVRAGEGWLSRHPERALITSRYLKHQRGLVAGAVDRLAEVDEAGAVDRLAEVDEAGAVDPHTGVDQGGAVYFNTDDPPNTDDPSNTDDPPNTDGPSNTDDPPNTDGPPNTDDPSIPDDPSAAGEVSTEAAAPLAQQRRDAVLEVLRAAGVSRVADLGCGDGPLLAGLLADDAFTQVVGADVSTRALEQAGRRLRLDRLPAQQRARLQLFQSSLTYRDPRLAGFDAAILMEVIEHVDPARLGALETTVFGFARPRLVVVTTPNAEHNVRFPGLPHGQRRHRDHRFEWTRGQFREWAERVASTYGYAARYLPVGGDDPEVGPPTQVAVFTSLDVPRPAAIVSPDEVGRRD